MGLLAQSALELGDPPPLLDRLRALLAAIQTLLSRLQRLIAPAPQQRLRQPMLAAQLRDDRARRASYGHVVGSTDWSKRKTFSGS